MLNERTLWAHERGFLGASFLLFLVSAATMIYWCTYMSGGMAMPGGWTMSMAWMSMPGQSLIGAAATFMGMWVVMMVAMMLPSLVPMLSIYRRSIRRFGHTHPGRSTVLAGAGYFFAWAIFGEVAYALGVVVVAAEMRWPALARSVPIATGVVLLLAGCVQLTAWKARQLGHCLDVPACGGLLAGEARSPWQHGLQLGLHCSLCCSGYMIILLVTGVMSLGAMAIVAAAITVERFVPWPRRAARVAGVISIAAGILVIVRALGVA